MIRILPMKRITAPNSRLVTQLKEHSSFELGY